MHKLLFLATFLYSCASVQSLTGGEKDTIPPQIISTSVDSGALEVTTQDFTFTFNENITTSKISELLLISPSQKQFPDIATKGRKLKLTLKDALIPNTTYTIQFNGSVLDINESNPLTNYTYIFSTGSYLDSLSTSGYITEALTDEPCSDCNVHLYTSFNDSNVFLSKPNYIAKTEKTGYYQFNNLPRTEFMLVAIKDINKNLSIDDQEQISLSKTKNTEELQIDTLIIFPFNRDVPYTATLIKNKKPGYIDIKLNKPALHPIKLTINNTTIEHTLSQAKDTIKAIYKPISDTSTITISIDTSTITLTQILPLNIKYDLRLQSFLQDEHVIIKCNTPLVNFDSSQFSLLTDSIVIPIQHFEIIDNNIIISYTSTQVPTKIIIYKDGITDILGHTNSEYNTSLSVPLTTNSNLILNIVTDSTNHILQLYKDDKLYLTENINSSKKLIYNNLPSGKYSCKLIQDTNNNNIWDTGNYLHKKSPETIIFLEPFDMRENWDKELTINTL